MNVWDTPLGKARLQELAISAAKNAQIRTNRRASGLSQRQYATARNSRTTAGWPVTDSSADSELISSITQMRSRSRALCRDSSYAKRAKTVIVNNVIGSGIGMQAQVLTTRDVLNERVNEDIEYAWCEWCEAENCHTGGRLSFQSLERALMAQVFEAGEVYVRIHLRPFGPYGLPFALELIEAERIADDISIGTMAIQPGHHFRLGLECDEFYKPVAYYIRRRHRGELRFSDQSTNTIERVPADQIIPLAVIDRWPQSRGEPWMHTAATRMNDMDGYSEAEILRARSQAVRMGVITSAEDSASFADEQDDGSFEIALEPNTVARLNPGEEWTDSSPSAPNPNLNDFMRYMLLEVAAGIGVSYESLSKDYSQSNYSSSRLALLDDRDLWRFYQSWFTRDFRKKVHRAWLHQAVLSGKIPSIPIASYALDPAKFEAVLFKPRGWSWIDPTKEVEAYKEAIRAGLTTRTDVIAATGGGQDIEDIDTTRERELAMAAKRGLVFDTDPDYYMSDAVKAEAAAKAAAKPPPKATEDSTAPNSAPPKAGRSIYGVAK
jgi:lambda family phage portal protein